MELANHIWPNELSWTNVPEGVSTRSINLYTSLTSLTNLLWFGVFLKTWIVGLKVGHSVMILQNFNTQG